MRPQARRHLGERVDCAKGLDTPMTKESTSSAGDGDQLGPSEGRRARRAIARINFMAQDRPDLSSAALSRISAHEFTNNWHRADSQTYHSVHQ